MQVVEVFTDPSCPWTWITSRWLREVAPQRDLAPRWRSYSLEIRDDGDVPLTVPEPMRSVVAASRAAAHQALRVFEALRAKEGEDAVEALYFEWGRRMFVPAAGPAAPDPDLLRDCLRACGLGPDWEAAGGEARWDEQIVRSMEIAYTVGGSKAKTPTLVLPGDPPRGITGPVMSPAPTGQAAVRLWDAVRALIDEPGFFELVRPRQLPLL